MNQQDRFDEGMLTVRPNIGAGWRIEIPREKGVFAIIVLEQMQALRLAEVLRPNGTLRTLLTPPDADAPESP